MLKDLSYKQIAVCLVFISLGALGLALIAEHVFGLKPCSLCMYQRYIYVALGLTALSICCCTNPKLQKALLYFCVFIMATGSAIAFYHFGVELNIFDMPQTCSVNTATTDIISSDDIRAQIYDSKNLPACNEVSFRFLGVSMTGWNCIFLLWLEGIVLAYIQRKKP